MDDGWLLEYEAALIDMFNGKDCRNVGYISYAAVRSIGPDSLEISWFPNTYDRFHEVSLLLPREAFVTCVDCPRYDEKPRIFVKRSWLSGLHLRPYSAFALVDAIGVKKALTNGQLSAAKLMRLRSGIDALAATNPGIALVSFADSLLLKINWFVGHYASTVTYSYEPESLVQFIPKIAEVFQDELGMKVYAAITQGVNEYQDTDLLHISGKHVCLNSLGLPFAQLLAIDEAARRAIRAGAHPPKDLYIDKQFYHSLRFRHDFDKHAQPQAEYAAPMCSVPCSYFYLDYSTVLSNLETLAGRQRRVQ